MFHIYIPTAHSAKFLFFATFLSLTQFEFVNFVDFCGLINNLLQTSSTSISVMGGKF